MPYFGTKLFSQVQPAALTTLPVNLISEYEFEEISGTTCIDSLSRYNGTNSSTSIYSTSSPKFGSGCYSYTGTQYTNFGSYWGLTTFPFSVSFWVNIPLTKSFQLDDTQNSSSTNYRGFSIVVNVDGSVVVTYTNGVGAGSGSRYSWQSAVGAFTTYGSWTLICITCATSISTQPILTINNTVVTLTYISGTAVSLVFTSAVPYLAVSSLLTTPVYYTFSIDQLAIWNKVLTVGEKTTLYNGGSGLAYNLW